MKMYETPKVEMTELGSAQPIAAYGDNPFPLSQLAPET